MTTPMVAFTLTTAIGGEKHINGNPADAAQFWQLLRQGFQDGLVKVETQTETSTIWQIFEQ